MERGRGEPVSGAWSRRLFLDLRQVESDLLGFADLGQYPVGQLTPKAALLASAERRLLVPVVGRLVDVHRTGGDALAEVESVLQAAREGRCRQAVCGVVGDLDGFVGIAEDHERS